MAWVDASYVDGSSGATPAHQVGDLIVVVATRWSTSAPTSVGSGFTDKGSFAGTYAMRIGWKVATATNDSTGTWGSATSLYVGIWRGPLGLGAVAALSASTTAQLPGITLQQPGSSLVATFATANAQAPTPAGCVSRWTDGNDRWADTNAAVSSWPAQSLSPQILAVSMELIPAAIPVSTTLAVSRDAAGPVSTTLAVSRSAEQYTVSTTLTVSRQSSTPVTTTLAVSRSAESFGTWRELVLTPQVLAAIAAPVRLLRSRAELVDQHGTPVAALVDGVPTLALPLAGATVEFRGEQPEQYSATMEWAHPWMVPTTPAHPLWGARSLFVRLWWEIYTAGSWLGFPVCTVAIGDTSATDNGTVSGSTKGRDVLSLLRGGYGAPLNVSGATIDVALRAIFERCAPTLAVRIAPTTTTVPASLVLGEQDPLSDVLELAAIGYPDGTVRSDREGVVECGPRPEPTSPLLDWQEGPDCPVSEMARVHGIEHMGNRITVSSTHADAVGLYVVVEDDDPSSPTYVGGPWGIHPLPSIETDKAVTEAALRSLGSMHLGRGLKPTEDVDVTIPQRPDLTYRHPVKLSRALVGVAGVHEVSSWSLVMPVSGEPPAQKKVTPAPMKVGMMRRYVR